MKKINRFLSLLLVLPISYANGSEMIKQKVPKRSTTRRKLTSNPKKITCNYGIQVPYESISKSKCWTQIKRLSSGITKITDEDVIINFVDISDANSAKKLLINSLKTESNLWIGCSSDHSGVRISVPESQGKELQTILDLNSTFKELIFPTNLGENNLVVNVNAPQVSKNVLESLKGLVKNLASNGSKK